MQKKKKKKKKIIIIIKKKSQTTTNDHKITLPAIWCVFKIMKMFIYQNYVSRKYQQSDKNRQEHVDSFSSEKLRVTSEISYLCSLLVYLCFIFSCLAYRCDLIEFGYNLNWILFGLGIASITLTVCGVATGIIGWAIRRTVSTRVTGRGS